MGVGHDGAPLRLWIDRCGIVGDFERIGGGRHAASYSNPKPRRLSLTSGENVPAPCAPEWRLPMARGLNGSANGSGGHVPTGREVVEARLPGVSNLPPAVAGALPAVVGLRTTVPKDRRSAQTLGTEREGHGVLIGDDGLIVTIGYLITEADTVTITDIDGNDWAAYIVGYDYESGFGLVRTERPIRLKPVVFGDSDTLELRSEAYVAGLGGEKATLKVKVAGRREFAGYWEYLLDNAIFTVPAYPLWGGSALIGQDGSLLGIGSLLVQEALGPGAPAFPGNMYVPINRLKPIFRELVDDGRISTPA